MDDILKLLGLGGVAAAGGLLTGEAYQRLGDIGEQARTEAGQLAQQQLEQTQFRPFTVTTGTGGQFQTTPEGGMGLSLSPQEQAISQQLMGQAGQMFGQPVAGQAQLTQAGLGALGTGQQLMGQPTFGMAPTQAASQQAFGLGGQFMGAAGAQPADINLLRGQFAGEVGGLMGQQPSAGVGALGQQALGLGGARLAGGVPDVTQTFAGVQAPGVRTAAGDLAARGLGLGIAGLETAAPSDVEALRQQYGGLAGQAAQQVLQPTGAREAEVFERIRATQRPEEERQRLALEQRLAAQGRLGTRSAAYGGATPEQLAMATAQEEARNRASLSALQQAQAERRQSLGEAQALGGMFTQQAGLSSQLQSQAQQRASQLSQLGLSAERVQAQLESEGFGREMQLAGAGLQAQQAQSALESQAQQRATQLAQLGLSAEQIQSRLQTEGLGRATTAAGQAAQLAQVAGGLQAQQAGLGAQFAGLGATLAGQQQALDAARQQQALQALTAGQGLLTGGLGLQQAQQQLGTGALGASYLPQAQALNVLQAGLPAAEMAQRGQLQGAGLYGQAEMSGLEALLGSGVAQANLYGQLGTGLLGGVLAPSESNPLYDLIGNLFKDD